MTGYTFKENQIIAYHFLLAFYNRKDLGYSVDNHASTEVTQYIIDTVDDIGITILSESRILDVCNFFLSVKGAIDSALDIADELKKPLPSRARNKGLFILSFANAVKEKYDNIKDSVNEGADNIVDAAMAWENIFNNKITEDLFHDEYKLIRNNRLAWTYFRQILNKEKGNIELSFQGFM